MHIVPLCWQLAHDTIQKLLRLKLVTKDIVNMIVS